MYYKVAPPSERMFPRQEKAWVGFFERNQLKLSLGVGTWSRGQIFGRNSNAPPKKKIRGWWGNFWGYVIKPPHDALPTPSTPDHPCPQKIQGGMNLESLAQTWSWVWVHPWVGLGRKFSWLKWVGLGSVTRIYIFRYYNYQTVQISHCNLSLEREFFRSSAS